MADHQPPSRRSSTASRRTLRRQPSRLSTAGSALDIFGDENAVDFDLVADGFAPGSANDTTPRASLQSSQTTIPQPPPRAASPPRVSEYLKKRLAGQERGSTASSRSSLSVSRREPPVPQRASSVSTTSEAAGRPLSTVSGLSTPVSEQPYNASSGPSHPYAMYPQVSSLNRSTSTSTVQTQSRQYTGTNRPTHPYAMYPQIPAASSELDDPFSDPADIANVGFPGLGQSYARRLGPDGEEADDLIGPDGHTEQLPPYSRYPDEMHPKQRAEISDSEPLLPASAAASSTAVASSEAHPEMSQTDTLLDNEEGVHINQGAARAAGMEDELGRRAKWKAKSKRRTCWGKIPIWAWIVLVAFLIVLAAILGAVVGTHVATNNIKAASANATAAAATAQPDQLTASETPTTTYWQTVTTTLVDATPLTATPTNIPHLPTGTYALPIQVSNLNNDTNWCLRNRNQTAAWGCNTGSYLSLTVEAGDKSTHFVTMFAEYPEDYPLYYGPQPPSMRGPAQIQLMNDMGNMDAGPAYFFQQLYDKVMIVPNSSLTAAIEEAFGPGNSMHDVWTHPQFNENSNLYEEDLETIEAINDVNEGRLAVRRGISWRELEERGGSQLPVMTGDQPWYCFWNSTILEGFIYADVPSHPTPNESQYISSMVADAIVTGAPSRARPSDGPRHDRRDKDRGGPPYDPSNIQSAYAAAAAASDNPIPPSTAYPLRVQIEERRSINMPTPYCQQMQAQRDGTIVPRRDPFTMQRIMFNLEEKEVIVQHNISPNVTGDPEPPDNQSRSLPAMIRDSIVERDQDQAENICRCAWIFD